MWKPLQTTVEDLPAPRPSLIILEVAVVTLLLPALGLWRHSADPFFLHASFPWLVLGPLLLALRYGFAQGLTSAMVLSLLMYGFYRAGRLGVQTYPGSLALGLLLTGMLAGEFCDMWHRRLERLSELNRYRQDLVQKFTRSYQLLSMSHEQLERRVLANTRSLRETMTFLRERALAVKPNPADSRELHHLMMEVLSSFGWLQVAALYLVDDHGILIPKIVAKLGNPKPVPIDDPMLVHAMQKKRLACIRPESTPKLPPVNEESGPVPTYDMLLAVLPLTDIHGRIWGMVTVQAMPFEAFSPNHLNLLAVIGGHMGDLLALGAGGGAYQFHTALMRGHIDARDHRLAAMLLGVRVDPALAPPTLMPELLELHRGLDQQWLTQDRNGQPVLLLVMPLTDAEGGRGFVQRLENFCQNRYGKTLADVGVRTYQSALDGVGGAEEKLRALKEACEIHVA